MQPNHHPIRGGLTLIETVASITIIGIVASILIPAVQAVRESARKVQCQNNLKQTALAIHAFHNAKNNLPSHYNGTSLTYPLSEWDLFHTHSWRAALLPYIEQSALHDSITWNSLATERINEVIATTVVPTYICPSGASPTASRCGLRHDSILVPEPDQTEADKYPVVRSDYEGMAGILVIPKNFPSNGNPHDTRYIRWGVWGWPNFDNGAISGGNLIRYRPGKFSDVSDGLSNTIMLVEQGGGPIHLIDGVPAVTTLNPNADPMGQNGWSASNTFQWAINGHDVGVNHDNDAGIYSTHIGGAYVAMADGSIAFLSESTDFEALTRMFGRSDGE